ncbi:hypothetical protein M9Y10_041309 [Tritrichomonas musculus]|uniref:Uncharacterized protein n=1 Tax=Tritrichomonas musculus TaxID=1915356 RepID=A0ABR2K4K7_9EUKA
MSETDSGDSPYSLFQQPQKYDISNIFSIDPATSGSNIERPSRPRILPSNIQYRSRQQYTRRNADVDELVRDTSAITMNPLQLVF